MPFLEVLTRCYKRPQMLAANIASMEAQTDLDYTHTFLVDDIGRGVEWSYANMRDYAPKLTGDYIWILDDDDECVEPTLIETLKTIVGKHDPDIVMLHMYHGQWGVKPSYSWGNKPEIGDIGCSAYIVRRDIWQHHAELAWKETRYQSDFDFITSIFEGGYKVAWYDVVASRVQKISQGAIE